ncbi:MAG: response regulator [Candidatus Pristimantibacillus sp.]
MKVLIVDDEQHVREAIRLLIDWHELGIEHIYEADNGDAAVELVLKVQPEIVITDMRMPHRDGVELLAWLQEEGMICKTIVVSGHDDFDLVRSSMKYGGLDYILKPIDPDQLTDALVKAKNSWEQEDRERKLNQKRNIEMNQIKPVYWDKLFSSLISEQGGNSSILNVLKEEFMLEQVHECKVVILSTVSMEQTVTNKFMNNRDLLFFALTNVCNEFLIESNRGFAFRYWNSEHEIILLFWNRLDEWQGTLQAINEGILKTIHSRFDLGIGNVQSFPSSVTHSYQTARTALKQRNVLEDNSWMHPYNPHLKTGVSALSMNDYEERFRLAIWSNQEKDIISAVDFWIDAVKLLTTISMEQLELWHYEYESLLNRWQSERKGKQGGESEWKSTITPLPILLDERGRLSLTQWRQELSAGLIGFASRTGADRQRENNVMHDIAKYMEQNYNGEVTLQHISERFYLSREYISRRFKQEMGENVFDFLGRIRIKKAKLLLQNPHLKITQIADMVGYEDEKYFSKVFKKFEGCSPNQYRKQ